jgi:rRNA biogenesis protein RRP5
MAYWLQLSELERAREVAERAVKNTTYRDDQERFNVWVAYLNLEASFGSKVEELFKRAVPYNHPKKVYLQMAHIWQRLEKNVKAREAFKACCTKFPTSKRTWSDRIAWLFQIGELTEARQVLTEALARLPKKKHLQVITKVATLEYKHGSRERGKTMFEGVVTNYPSRLDLWSLYFDQAIKSHTPPVAEKPEIEPVRQLFSRSTTLSLKPFKMKFFYKRWLAFEKQHGDPAGEASVRRKAQEFIASIAT